MAKTTGIVRKLDQLGRIVIPIEARRTMGWAEKDDIEISFDGDKIVLQKWEPNCIFCNETRNLTEYNGKRICTRCKNKLAEL